MPNPTTPTADAGDFELRKRLDNIVMAIVNFGHQVITEQHTDKKTFVYGAPKPMVISRVDAVPLLMQLIQTREREAVSRAVETAIGLVGKYSIHAPKGQPKGTLARKRLINKLHQLAHPKKEDK